MNNLLNFVIWIKFKFLGSPQISWVSFNNHKHYSNKDSITIKYQNSYFSIYGMYKILKDICICYLNIQT